MKLVFEPLVTTLLTSFLLFLIACFLFLNSKRILTIGYHTLTIVCVLSIVRLLFPFEFSFTKNIYLNETAARIAGFFRKKHMLSPNIKVSVFDIGTFIWLIGIIIKLYKYVKTYKNIGVQGVQTR